MPNVYVFPGGRVEPQDRAPSGFAEPLPRPPAKLDRFTQQNLAVLARTALRETFEETGLLVGTAAVPTDGGTAALTDNLAEPWRSYREVGLQPAFAALHLVARAITPANSPIRFHSRFFRAEGSSLHGCLGGSGELTDIGWVPITETSGLPMSGITALILRQALAHRAASRQGLVPAPALFRWIGGRRSAQTGHSAPGADPAPPQGRVLESGRQRA